MSRKSTAKETQNQQRSSIPLIRRDWLEAPKEFRGQRHVVRLRESYCIAYVGTRGSGKTFSLAYIGAKGLAANLPVFANFKIEFNLLMPDGTKRHCCSQPLDWDALYKLDEGISNGMVLISEFQYYADSRRSMTLNNRMINAIIAQVRKRSLFFAYDVKNISWVDNHIQWETDIEITCKDAYYTPWGAEQNVQEKGELIFWYPQDMSGQWTGRDNSMGRYQNYYDRPSSHWIRVKPLRGIYDTSEIIDYFDAMAGLDINQPRRQINVGLEEQDAQHQAQRQDMVTKVLQAFNRQKQYMDRELWSVLGVTSQAMKAQFGAVMREMGIYKRQNRQGYIYVMDE